ncbi:MAG TPA: C45 family autoproteolytic acyltransferase/hydrolase [Candidatus Bathyarchaeia archaeon]|nr:C45 family autoproteolytic acyltransferase/hydrolase [Candidatus Bathyarchaeia archaeon]
MLTICSGALAQVGGYGSKTTVGEGSDAITLVRLGGTRYQMGYWYGYLLADQIAACAAAFDGAYTEPQFADATAAMWNSDYFDTAAYESELNGIADGCAANSHSEITFEKLRRLQLIPDMSEAGCGLFALWGNATKDGHLYQLRNLDWSMDTGAQDYPVVAIYSPVDGNRHAVIGFAGMIGGAVGGIGDKGIALSEIMGGFGDAEGTPPIPFSGVPFTFLLRDCIYHDTTLQQALNRINTATRTNEYHYCISGKDAEGNDDARLLFTSNTRFDEFGGGDEVVHPNLLFDPTPFYAPLADAVYWKRHDGGAYAMGGPEDDRKGNQTLYAAINARYGNIDAAAAIEIARADGVSGTVVSIVYDTTDLKFWVAYADGPTDPATNQNYVEFDLTPPATAYSLGTPTDLLDAEFYAGEPVDGSNVAGREAFWGRTSNDGETVAFFAINRDTRDLAVFLVDVGDPDSWRRLTVDLPVTPSAPIYWTPDDLYLIVGNYRVALADGQLLPHSIHGYTTNDSSITKLPTDNWLISYAPSGMANADLVALPIWSDGQADPARQPVILTNLLSSGIRCDWPFIAADGSKIAFVHYAGGEPGWADFGDIYVLKNVPSIIAAPKVPDTLLSSMAPSSLINSNIIPIHTTESDNFTHIPSFSQDLSLVFFTEDRNNVHRDQDFFNTIVQADFDIVIANADGSGEEVRFAQPGNQIIAGVTPGGTRVLYMADVAGAMHLYITTLDIATTVVGAPYGAPANNDVITTSPQQATDASGTVVDIPTGVTIDFPPGEPQQIQITTPVELTEIPVLPGVEAIPVVREFGPDGTNFDPPITVTISYTDAEVEGFDEINLKVFTYNSVSGIYDIEVTTITNRDLVNNTISFTVAHFSKFGLAAEIDTDADGTPDVDDLDDDNDGVLDVEDPYPLDTDNDGIDNEDDPDDDSDGIPDGDDTYPLDTDNDGLDNAADSDDDGDGLADGEDPFEFDSDNDGLINALDSDDDADGILDAEDALPLDTDNDGENNETDTDDDGDGISDTEEGLDDPDGDGIVNMLDTNSDNDGLSDEMEVRFGTDPYDVVSLNALPLAWWMAALCMLLATVSVIRRRRRAC